MDSISVEEFLEGLAQRDPLEACYVGLGGDHPLPVRAKIAPGAKTLTVLFHGAINRQTREYPAFLGYLAGVHPHSHQISIADPTLLLSEEITNGWFTGSRGTPLQRLLPRFFTQIQEALEVERVIFVGSSGGGFGALYYSWACPGSVAVVQVPQTNILTYYSRRRDQFLQHAWGHLTDSPADEPCLDLRQAYGAGMDNTVIYLQSTLDDFHMSTQMIPFLSSLSQRSVQQMTVWCSYWGRPGHSSAVPTEERDAWVRAAIDAAEPSAHDIVQSYDMANPSRFRAAGSLGSEPAKKADGLATRGAETVVESRDVALTDRIVRDALLQGDARHA